ncbi:hypothetical protein ZIOFF_004472 [Zingiber officinale]|uniref:VQ domain-containing protein n=2 Tax=Zingiber officinale TaxID=94328 RepID=A0A8J5I1T8_ZINOF|nr:hypothetical protein ZIOFF_004472 [Zingiber officinale]
MATSDDTTSGPTQWSPLGLWTQSSSSPPTADASDSIIVTAASTSPTINGQAAKANIEGRVGKSGRRRSRASRRAPTTMLNTDTANFRSMVQQFTGIMSGPYPYPILDTVHSIRGYNFNDPIISSSSSSSSVHRPSAMPMELQQQYQYYAPSHHGQHAREQQQASQNEISLFVPESNNSSANLDQVGDDFFADAMYAQWMPASRPTSNPNIKVVDDDFYF